MVFVSEKIREVVRVREPSVMDRGRPFHSHPVSFSLFFGLELFSGSPSMSSPFCLLLLCGCHFVGRKVGRMSGKKRSHLSKELLSAIMGAILQTWL